MSNSSHQSGRLRQVATTFDFNVWVVAFRGKIETAAKDPVNGGVVARPRPVTRTSF
jgi:hypothetical protein